MTDINTRDTRSSTHGLPERIKVTISHEDGSPLFTQDRAAQVEYLTDAAPALIVWRNGGSVDTVCGDIFSVNNILQDLLEHERRPKRRQGE